MLKKRDETQQGGIFMYDWIESKFWKKVLLIFNLARDIALVTVAIIGLIIGLTRLPNFLIAISTDIQVTNGVAQTAKAIAKGNEITIAANEMRFLQKSVDKAPKTEQPIDSTKEFAEYNIKLSDFDEQFSQVRSWLKNPYSGYPALVKKIQTVMNAKRFIGNGVPLTIINEQNLKLHNRETSAPIVNVGDIDDSKLKQALYASWQQKNSGVAMDFHKFEEIIEPQK